MRLARGLVRKLDELIRFAFLFFSTVKNFPDFVAVQLQQPASWPSLYISFFHASRASKGEARGNEALRAGGRLLSGPEIAQHLTHLVIGDPAVGDEPVPGALAREFQLFEAAHHSLAGDALTHGPEE